MILELYGLPGAGKTTIIKNLTDGNATTVSGIGGTKKVFIQLAKKMAVYFPSTINCKHKMHDIMRKYDNKCRYTNTLQNHHYNNIALVVFGYKNMKNSIYMDEGLIHRIITMAVNFGVSDEDTYALVDLFKSYLKNIRCLYLDVPIEECMKSIFLRDRHKCEMDEFDDETLLRYLKDYKHYCKAICDKYKHEIITRENYEIIR